VLPLQDEFLLEHARTDKYRFLDLLRARFALQVSGGAEGTLCPVVVAAGGRQWQRQCHS